MCILSYFKVINENIATRVKPPKDAEIENKGHYFDEIQAKKFLEYVLETELLIVQTLAFVTMYGGLRKGEILAINWGDVNFQDNTINIDKALARASKEMFIKEPKNKSSIRIVTLPAPVMRLLKELKLSSTDIKVFPLDYSTPSHWFKRVLRSYNKKYDEKLPENVTFHGLRHTSATLLIAQVLDIKSVSTRLGHSATTTTLNVYTHAVKSRGKIASDALENILDIDINR